MDAATHRLVPAERVALACALMAAACAIGSLVLGAGLAFAWLADQTHLMNELSVAPVEAPIQEAYAALYENPDGTGASLVFDRGDEVPESRDEQTLVSSWRGLETGTDDFSSPGVLPWKAHAGSISHVTCGDAAQKHPIKMFYMQACFKDMTALACADVSGITPSPDLAQRPYHASKDLSSAFQECVSLERIIGLETWDVSEITQFNYLFTHCCSLRSLDLTAWDPKSVRIAAATFGSCTSLEHLDITGWNMESCQDASGMFSLCPSLTEITGLETLRCPHVGNMNGTFSGSSSLERIDLSGCDMPGNGILTKCSGMMSGCSSLRYLDLSGIQIDQQDLNYSWGMYSEAPTLETLILSNKIKVSQAPIPAAPHGLRSNMDSPGYWICDSTEESFGQHGLMRYVDGLYCSWDDVEKVSFHAFCGGWGEDDPYAAAYQKEDGNMLLIMDRGEAAPDAFEGLPLVLEMRDFLVDGERGSAAWRSMPITEARILADLKPISCRRWFREMNGLQDLAGLEHLDMSECADVTEMFRFVGADHLAIEGWKVRPDAESLTNIFALCYRVLKLDLSQWTIDQQLNLAQLDRLIELTVPSNIRISRLDYRYDPTVVRFDDGTWYKEGLGDSLSSEDVRNAVNAAYGTGSAPVRYSHEKEDRSYAAVYRGQDGDALVFGRGLDIPEEHPRGTLQASYRGLEEQGRTNIPWIDFKGDACPWAGFADGIIAVECDDAARTAPIRPSNMIRWFEGMGSVQEMAALEAGALDATRVRDASWLFFSCSSLQRIPRSFLASFTEVLEEARGMFGYCSTLTDIAPLGFESTRYMRDSTQMFEGCSSLTSLDLGFWDISSLRYCSSMFRGCWKLETLSLPAGFVAPQRTDALQLAFLECYSLKELDGSTWDLSGTTTLFHAFNECMALERIHGASEWDTSAVATMNSAFRHCRVLVLDCSAWDIGSVTDSDSFALGAPGVTSPFESVETISEELMDELRADGAAPHDEIRTDDAGEDDPEHDTDQDPGTAPGTDQDGSDADASEDLPGEQQQDPEEGGSKDEEASMLTQGDA